MMGRHIWEFAQMADALGKRTFELRLPEQHSIAPVAAYDALLKEVVKTSTTAERTAAFYDGMIPGIIARFQQYIAATDEILDEPSIVVLQRASSISSASASTRPSCSANWSSVQARRRQSPRARSRSRNRC